MSKKSSRGRATPETPPQGPWIRDKDERVLNFIKKAMSDVIEFTSCNCIASHFSVTRVGFGALCCSLLLVFMGSGPRAMPTFNCVPTPLVSRPSFCGVSVSLRNPSAALLKQANGSRPAWAVIAPERAWRMFRECQSRVTKLLLDSAVKLSAALLSAITAIAI
jgi:hypothetical protein